MSGYTKLFGTIVGSAIWSEDDQPRLVWITMLAIANAEGKVDASIPGLAQFARVPLDATQRALDRLKAPDQYSRTKDFEGRRVVEIDGGWLILNYKKYRNQRDPEARREYMRRYIDDQRADERLLTSVNSGNPKQRQRQRQKQTNGDSECQVPVKLRTTAFLATWTDWTDYRHGFRKPKDWSALFGAQLEYLARFDVAMADEMLKQSMRNGWQGIFEVKGRNGNHAP